MQQRRFRPGDVLDDYCPRERRITDHAIVAMIGDNIKQTRCVVCDSEHEFKHGKVPPQRRKKAQTALFTQVLDGLQPPQPAGRLATTHDLDAALDVIPGTPVPVAASLSLPLEAPVLKASASVTPAAVVDETPVTIAPGGVEAAEPVPGPEEGPVRRPLIRATLPRPEGQPMASRALPEFTIRQPNNTRGRQGRQRKGHHQGQGGAPGAMRFGRGEHGQGQRHGSRHHGSHSGRGGARRGGKKG